jgi:hypothetical protein
VVLGPGNGALLLLLVLHYSHPSRANFQYSGILSNQFDHTKLSTHKVAIIMGETLTQIIHNPIVPVDEKTHEPATTILQQLANIYDILPAMASPRMATVPAGYASPKVATVPTQDAFPRVLTNASPVAATQSATMTAINLQQGWANAITHPITGVAMEY